MANLTTLGKKPSENIVGKGENAGNQHFLLFPQRFLSCERRTAPLEPRLLLLSANALDLNNFLKKVLIDKE